MEAKTPRSRRSFTGRLRNRFDARGAALGDAGTRANGVQLAFAFFKALFESGTGASRGLAFVNWLAGLRLWRRHDRQRQYGRAGAHRPLSGARGNAARTNGYRSWTSAGVAHGHASAGGTHTGTSCRCSGRSAAGTRGNAGRGRSSGDRGTGSCGSCRTHRRPCNSARGSRCSGTYRGWSCRSRSYGGHWRRGRWLCRLCGCGRRGRGRSCAGSGRDDRRANWRRRGNSWFCNSRSRRLRSSRNGCRRFGTRRRHDRRRGGPQASGFGGCLFGGFLRLGVRLGGGFFLG